MRYNGLRGEIMELSILLIKQISIPNIKDLLSIDILIISSISCKRFKGEKLNCWQIFSI